MNIWHRIPLALKILIPGIAVVLVVANAKPKPEPAPFEPPEVVKTRVKTVAVDAKSHVVTVTTQGTVEAIRRSQLMPQVSGKITYVADAFADGGHFTAQQTLLKIDDSDYKLAVVSAKAELAEAKMQLATEQALSKEAAKQWQDLGDPDANQLFKRKPQLIAAQAKVAAAQARLEKANLDLTRTTISLPFAGRIESTSVGVGQFVTSGSPLAQILDTSQLQVKLPLTEQQASLIALPNTTEFEQKNKQNPVLLTAHFGGKKHQWSAHISRTSAKIDNKTRMLDLIVDIPAHAQISNYQLPLLIGLFVEANISSKPIEKLIELPKDALFKRNQIYLIGQNEQVKQAEVQVIARTDKHVWISSEQLQNGDQVIINKLGFLSPGTAVEAETTRLKVAQKNQAAGEL
ncbi:efflux RND transporter periplasmic adaptor subunit [Catenovulum sediminis]|uniref:Efflux RND transporter periplasmic adaptor subunit n=1 Tax=Catenovulum sediminis TaxID=1740262 RepID=A0ABV1RMA4_9ALTE|nr:efflux RND transporter periplasmic adaptor subunit [Catenovulum sediminis]